MEGEIPTCSRLQRNADPGSFDASSPERRMNKFHPVFDVDFPCGEVLPVNKCAIYLNNYCRVIFLCLIEQILHREIAAFKFFRIAIENDIQTGSLPSIGVGAR